MDYDVIRLENSLQKKLRESEILQKYFTIFKVPDQLGDGYSLACKPTTISIGPYHRREPKLVAMEGYKLQYVNDLLERVKSGLKLKDFASALRKLEQPARLCYSDDPTIKSMSSDDFVEMLLVDGFFIIEFMLKLQPGGTLPIISTRWKWLFIRRDLLALENQLPFFVLQYIYNLVNRGDFMPLEESLQDELIEKLLQLFSIFQSGLFMKLERKERHPYPEHLLHLLHSSLRNPESQTTTTTVLVDPESQTTTTTVLVDPESQTTTTTVLVDPESQTTTTTVLVDPESQTTTTTVLVDPESQTTTTTVLVDPESQTTTTTLDDPESQTTTPSRLHRPAKELELHGVRLVSTPTTNGDGNILDVKFSKGALKMPPLLLDEHSEVVLRNFVALEQCDQKHGMDFSCYVDFIKKLVDSKKDVNLLVKRGIIINSLGSSEDAVKQFFNGLCFNMILNDDKNYLLQTQKEMEVYCKRMWPKWIAKFTRDHFTSPWSILSFVAALVILALTVLQAIISLIKFVNGTD